MSVEAEEAAEVAESDAEMAVEVAGVEMAAGRCRHGNIGSKGRDGSRGSRGKRDHIETADAEMTTDGGSRLRWLQSQRQQQ